MDTLKGGAGNNILIGDSALLGNIDVSEIFGLNGIYLEEAVLIVPAEGDVDYLYGGPNMDVLLGGGGNDTLYGGNGFNLMFGDGFRVSASVFFGVLQVPSLDSYFELLGDGEDKMFGGADSDVMVGGKGIDELYGCAGTDWLFGNDGNDFLDGGDGFDMLNGGDGEDSFRFGDTGDYSIFFSYWELLLSDAEEGDTIEV